MTATTKRIKRHKEIKLVGPSPVLALIVHHIAGAVEAILRGKTAGLHIKKMTVGA